MTHEFMTMTYLAFNCRLSAPYFMVEWVNRFLSERDGNLESAFVLESYFWTYPEHC